MRKTIEVEFIKEKVNKFLRESKDEQIKEREAQASLLNSILFETGNYKGFSYINFKQGDSGFYGRECRVQFI